MEVSVRHWRSSRSGGPNDRTSVTKQSNLCWSSGSAGSKKILSSGNACEHRSSVRWLTLNSLSQSFRRCVRPLCRILWPLHTRCISFDAAISSRSFCLFSLSAWALATVCEAPEGAAVQDELPQGFEGLCPLRFTFLARFEFPVKVGNMLTLIFEPRPTAFVLGSTLSCD